MKWTNRKVKPNRWSLMFRTNTWCLGALGNLEVYFDPFSGVEIDKAIHRWKYIIETSVHSWNFDLYSRDFGA